MLNQALGKDDAQVMKEVKKKAQEIVQAGAILAESKNEIDLQQVAKNEFHKIQETYMKSLEYNYQR